MKVMLSEVFRAADLNLPNALIRDLSLAVHNMGVYVRVLLDPFLLSQKGGIDNKVDESRKLVQGGGPVSSVDDVNSDFSAWF
jgi:hypothetical protein